MTKIEPEQELEEKPLDPEFEKVRRKMVRLLVVSASIMVIALMAVLVAIVYKTDKLSDQKKAAASDLSVPSEAPLMLQTALPDGFTVTSTALSNGQILFYGKDAEGKRKAYVFDVKAGRMIADISISGK